nr:uncharacterized protein LOC109192306 [Ipomoea trifida]
MVSKRGDEKAKEVTPKTSDEGGEETEVLPGCIDGSASRAFEITQAVVLPRQENAPVSTYYMMMAISPQPKCVYRGCTYNMSKQLVDMKEKEQLYDFLMGLDDEFAAVKSQILSSK